MLGRATLSAPNLVEPLALAARIKDLLPPLLCRQRRHAPPPRAQALGKMQLVVGGELALAFERGVESRVNGV